ncbi:hypothetical protein ACJIZ3_022908 [Penstemon smallii]|uniref:Peptidyl-prolyl cis-trans isomerase n=1 Tax=Penstemon smallii TaxID=265156 RepID=A0ABD3TNG7_9LAMI
MSVMLVTSLGDIVVDLFTDRCPLTCKKFLKIKYYNGCLFHNIQKDFTAQTGDPTGTGSRGDSVNKFLYGDQARFFGDEIHSDVKHSKIGTLAMANAGKHLNASQFYITLRDGHLDYLDGKHTIRITDPTTILIRIKHTYILDDPFADPPQLSQLIPDVEEDVRLEDDWIPMDEQLNPQELEEVVRAKDARSSAAVLESVGDIPYAEIKPPENVLFVCKLNPVTKDEDLHLIFSERAKPISTEVIRDHKTGVSLGYAFIEFKDKIACEVARSKMKDKTMIDDRKIHVDYSQSVAKLWSQYRRRSQIGQGEGCFKGGSLGHIVKDCTTDYATSKNSKYKIKDDNTRWGGDGITRYEMELADISRKHRKLRRDHKAEQHDAKPSTKRLDYNNYSKDEDRKRRDTHRDKERREDEQCQTSPYRRGRERHHLEKYERNERRNKRRREDRHSGDICDRGDDRGKRHRF